MRKHKPILTRALGEYTDLRRVTERASICSIGQGVRPAIRKLWYDVLLANTALLETVDRATFTPATMPDESGGYNPVTARRRYVKGKGRPTT